MTQDQLIQLGNAFAVKRGWTLSTLSTYAVSDGKFFNRLATGRTCTIKTAARLAQWFSDHWPADLPWPADIPRPVKTKEATRCD